MTPTACPFVTSGGATQFIDPNGVAIDAASAVLQAVVQMPRADATDPDGAVYAPGAFVLALGSLRAEQRVGEAFRTGAGMG